MNISSKHPVPLFIYVFPLLMFICVSQSVQAVFRSIATLEKTVEKCHIELDEQKNLLTFTLHCKHGICFHSCSYSDSHCSTWTIPKGLHLISTDTYFTQHSTSCIHHIVFYVLVSVFSLQASWRHITCLSRTVKAYRQCSIRTATPMYSDLIPGLSNLLFFLFEITDITFSYLRMPRTPLWCLYFLLSCYIYRNKVN